MVMQGDGDGDGDMAEPDAAVTCRPNPDADANPGCPEICPEACNDADDDCDGVVDEGADDTACAVANATSICTRGLCILSACDGGFRDCDSVRENGCEVDIATPDNCGACGVTCEYDNTAAVCVDGVCEPGACVAPYLDCDGEDGLCETFAETLSDCGGCGVACGMPDRATPICMDGACVVDQCLGNFGDCNDDVADGCELPLNTPSHCGGCGIPCAFAGSATNCDNGACIVDSCSPGFADCDGSPLSACDSLDSDDHCGGCGRQCTAGALDNVAAAGCDTRTCVVECESGFGDCDGEPINGCETPLTGVNNCTGCGVACSPDRALGDCGGGSCQVGVCDDGWADCDGDPDNGCETNTGRPEDCGGCGVQCQVSPPIGCNGAICTGVLCPEDEADCDGNDTCEADLSSDATCGSCGVTCAFDNNVDGHGSVTCAVDNSTPGQMAWGCEVTCTDGFADCDGDYRNGCEVDLTDLNNCGGCGNVCTKTRATPTCENRVCQVDTCDLDWDDCDNDDLDCETQLNSANDCGSCGNECDFPFAAAACSGSPGSRQCIIQQCVPVEYESCDGRLDTGCESDTRSDADNCNGCGNDCTMGPQVQGGNCIDSACSYSCAPNYRDCTGASGCETNLLATGSCGDCDNDCLALPEVTSANCLPGGGNPVCEVTGCDGGFGDCNGDPGDGCEEPTNTSEAHCGACSGEPGYQPCANLTGVDTSTCNAGLCEINTCTGNLEDCNRVSSDGCEWNPAVDGMCCDPNMDDDGDGSDNCADGCPTDPVKVAPGVCGCFVADTDSDGDGAADCIDACLHNPGIIGACQPSRVPLTIQGSQVPSAQTGFPVLVSITVADMILVADPIGIDLAFRTTDGSPLPFEVESYDTATGTVRAWVGIDLTGSDQTFYLHYGDGVQTDESTPAAVWSNGFAAVYHMDYGGGGGTEPDSTANANNLSPPMQSSNPSAVTGQIGDGLSFATANGMLRAPDHGSLDITGALTISMWANKSGTNPSYWETIVSKRIPPGENCNYQFGLGNDGSQRNLMFFDGSTIRVSNQTIAAGIWSHVAVVVDGSTCNFYKDGVWFANATSCDMSANSGPLYVGGTDQEKDEPFYGALDEVRIADVVRSDDWLLTEVNSQKTGSSFIAVGAVEGL